MTKLMMIIGDDLAIAEISFQLKKLAQDWYNEGKKEFDADVKVFDFKEREDFHLG